MQNTNPSILMASNTASHAGQYASYLEARGFHVRCVYTGTDVIAGLRNQSADLVVADLDLPGGDGLWLLENLERVEFEGKIILLSADEKDPRLPLIASRAQIVAKPLTLGRFGQIVTQIMGRDMNDTLPQDLAGDTDYAGAATARRDSEFGGFIGTSQIMQALYEQIYNGARSPASVFITGESGTGKEVCAQAIHRHSPRAPKAFVPLNCAAIPRDLLESEIFGHVRGAFTGAVADRAGAATMAHGGTLFLDEIGDMDRDMQTKLLRFLQDGTFQRVGANRLEQVDVRIICATNRDPVADVRAGRFREDLFYRLHVIPITMPPLRARGQDIIDIAQTLLLSYAVEEKKRFKGFSADAERMLLQYPWPGNIRQLQNIIRHAIVMHDGVALSGQMLPAYLAATVPGNEDRNPPFNGAGTVRSLGDLDGSRGLALVRPRTDHDHEDRIMPLHLLERHAIENAIRHCHGNIPRAAALLQVSPSTLYRKKAYWEKDEEPGTQAVENRP